MTDEIEVKVKSERMERVEEAGRAFQRKLAGEWLAGRHLTEVARGAGVDLDRAEKDVAFGLLSLGEVSFDEMIRHRYIRPKGVRTLQPETAVV